MLCLYAQYCTRDVVKKAIHMGQGLMYVMMHVHVYRQVWNMLFVHTHMYNFSVLLYLIVN